jgi:5-methylcytosine-specific restriction enzyme A
MEIKIIFPHYRIGERVRKYSPEKLRELLAARDGMFCGICNRALFDFGGTNIDHKIPRAKGGSDNIDNLQIAHISCNDKKADRII